MEWLEGKRRNDSPTPPFPCYIAIPLLILLMVLVSFPPSTEAAKMQSPGRTLVELLRRGGYNLYFRHAPTDWNQNDRVDETGDWLSCDPQKMRQLSTEGRETARRIGRALRGLDLPIGEVLSSPYCRVAETARLMELGPVKTTRNIMNMRAAEYVGGRDAVIRRARSVLSDTPPLGTNRVIVGHGNLMRAATGDYAGEGGCGIYRPDPKTEKGFVLVARLSPGDWFRLAERFSETDSSTEASGQK